MSGVVLPEVATCSRYEFASVLDAASERCQHRQGCSHSSLWFFMYWRTLEIGMQFLPTTCPPRAPNRRKFTKLCRCSILARLKFRTAYFTCLLLQVLISLEFAHSVKYWNVNEQRSRFEPLCRFVCPEKCRQVINLPVWLFFGKLARFHSKWVKTWQNILSAWTLRYLQVL